MNKSASRVLVCMLPVFLAMIVLPATAGPAWSLDAVPQVLVLKGEKNFYTDVDPNNLDGTLNAVIEIPAGTTTLYKVNVKTGMIELLGQNGEPQQLPYLGYPCNYGIIPHTLLAGGKDSQRNPVAVCVLGPSVPTGSVVKARPVGVLNLSRGAMSENVALLALDRSPFAVCNNPGDLESKFPGATTILGTWFASQRSLDGSGASPTVGFKGRGEAIKLIGDAIVHFEKSRIRETDKRPLGKDGNPVPYYWPAAKNIGE